MKVYLLVILQLAKFKRKLFTFTGSYIFDFLTFIDGSSLILFFLREAETIYIYIAVYIMTAHFHQFFFVGQYNAHTFWLST